MGMPDESECAGKQPSFSLCSQHTSASDPVQQRVGLEPDLLQQTARTGSLHGGGVEERADISRCCSSWTQHFASPCRLCVPGQELQHQLWGDPLVLGLQACLIRPLWVLQPLRYSRGTLGDSRHPG